MKTMQKKYKVDKNRIYISGFSMGGMMTYHCMTKLGTVVAAFGPVSGILSIIVSLWLHAMCLLCTSMAREMMS